MSKFMRSCLVASGVLLTSLVAFGEEAEVSNVAPVVTQEESNIETETKIEEGTEVKVVSNKKPRKRYRNKGRPKRNNVGVKKVVKDTNEEEKS